MIKDSSKLNEGQLLKVDLRKVTDRLPRKLLISLRKDSIGKLVGYKMVDGNQFGLVIEFKDGNSQWFFEEELSEVEDAN